MVLEAGDETEPGTSLKKGFASPGPAGLGDTRDKWIKLCRRLRQSGVIPITTLFCTGRDSKEDIIGGA